MRLIFMLGCLLLVNTAFAGNVAKSTVSKLSYEVAEFGAEPYISQIWVSADWVRLDHQQDNDGYILYDRRKQVIYNINHDDAILLTINPTVSEHETPSSIKVETQLKIDRQAPQVAGKTPVDYQITVDASPCMQLIVLPDTMSQSLDGWQGFLARLSDQQVLNIPATPEEMRDNCNLVEHVYAPTLALKEGLPLIWVTAARKMRLVGFEQAVVVADDFFTMPDDYRPSVMPLN